MEIRTRNFQDMSIEADLGTRAFITGKHGSGKTAVVNAIQAALYGQVSGLGKEGTAALINGEAMADVLFNVDGKEVCIAHKFERTKKSIRTTPAIAIGEDVFRDAAASDIIGSYVPDLLYCDPTSFFALAGTARKDALLKYLVTTEGAKEQLAWVRLYALAKAWDKIKGAGAPNDIDPPTTEELEPLTTDFLTKLETKGAEGQNQEDSVRALHAIIEHEAGEAWEVIEALHEMKKDSAATKTNINKALDGLGQIAPADIQKQAGSLAELQAKHSDLSRQRAELVNASNREDRVSQEFSNAEEEVERLIAVKLRLEKESGTDSIKSLEARRLQAATTLSEVEANEPDPPSDANRDALWDAVVKIERKRGRVAGYGQLRGKIFKSFSEGLCPLINDKITCGADVKAVCEEQDEQALKLIEKLDEHDAELKGLRRELDMTQAAQDFKAKRQAFKVAVEKAKKGVNSLDLAIKIERDLGDVIEDLKIAQARAEKIRKTKSAAVDDAHREALNSQLAELEEDLNAARNAEAFQKLLRGVGVNDIYFDAALWSGAWEGAKAGRDAWIQARIGDVSERITGKLRGTKVFPKDAVFHIDVSAKKLELGIMSRGIFIDAAVLSNAQRSVFMLSMLAALPRIGKDCERRILLHDVDGILPVHYARLMSWLSAEDFDLVVLTSPHKPKKEVDGWKVFDAAKLEVIEDDDGTDLNEEGDHS